MVKTNSLPPHQSYFLFHRVLEGKADPVNWWNQSAGSYHLVARLQAATFQEATTLLQSHAGVAWYTRRGVDLLVSPPIRQTREGDVLVHEDGPIRETWMQQQTKMWASLCESTHNLLLDLSHSVPVSLVACSPDGRVFLGLDRDSLLRLYMEGEPRLCSNYGRHTGSIRAVAWSPDGRFIASGATSGELHIWDVETNREQLFYHAEGERVLLILDRQLRHDITAVAWSPDSRYVACGNARGTVRVLAADTGRMCWTYQCEDHPVESLGFSADGWYLATCCAGRVCVLDVHASGLCSQVQLEGDASRGRHVLAWSPAETLFLIGSSARHEVSCYRFATGEISHMCRIALSHTTPASGVNDLCFAPNGRFAIAGCADGTVQVVDIECATQRHIFHAHRGAVHSVAWSREGTRCVSGGEDMHLRVWSIPTGLDAHE